MSNNNNQALRDIVHQVRRRWRTRRALNGAAIALAITAAAFIAFALTLGGQDGIPDPGLLSGGRIGVALASLGAFAWFVVRPFFDTVSDERVALYIEEHEPSLEATLLGAVELSSGRTAAGELSPALVDRLIQSAVEKS